MRASARFSAALRQSHQVTEYAQVTTNSHEVIRLHVTTGQVTVDRSSQFRRSATLTCFDPTGALIPQDAKSILTPFGSSMQLFKGIIYTDGTEEVYSLGVFKLSEVDVVESNPTNATRVTIALTGYDKSRTISRDKFTSTYTIAAGTKVTAAFQQLVYRTFPDAQFDIMDNTLTLPYVLTYAVGDDPWQACTDLATSCGSQAYFDVDGRACLSPPADINSLANPSWDYIEGQGCTMTDIEAIYSDDPGYNGVIVVGASPGTGLPPIQAAVWDTDPSSPTYYLGNYGQVPQVINDTNVTTVADALAEATALLNAQLGFITQTDITCWTNPAIDIDDIVQVERANVSASGLYIVDAFSTPLGSSTTGTPAGMNSQSLTLRQKRS